MRKLGTLGFAENKKPRLLIENSGTGKTVLAVSLGMEVYLKGKSILFVSVLCLLLAIKKIKGMDQMTCCRKRFENYDLVIVDELGYSPFDKSAGEILFNLLSNRNEKG
ncbi:MAG: ATP-binding protein, partial [Erysipelotrichaceae bacterium]|nr:ATP-binding protein [Erysipelotrichaceae bacterium]